MPGCVIRNSMFALGIVLLQVLLVCGARDKWLQPFSSNSIWNLPIGASATYKSCQLSAPQVKGLSIDDDLLIFTPTASSQTIYKSSAGWSGSSRCNPDSGNQVLFTGPIPSNYLVADNGQNYGTAVILADNNTIFQTQPLCKCSATSLYTSMTNFALEYLDKEGLYGAHGGSGLSAIGGSIRLGELLAVGAMRHALKLNFAAQMNYYRNPCYRWPSHACDSYANDATDGYGGKVPGFVPGALLAIPASVDINSLGLTTTAAKSIAWTLQNYGAYVVDDTWHYDIFTLSAEKGPRGSVKDEFKATYGYDTTATSGVWPDDLDKIYTKLSVVDNWDFTTWLRVRNSAGAEGSGGGVARQSWVEPLLPAIAASSTGITRYQILSDGTNNGWSSSSDGQTSTTTDDKFSGSTSQKLVTTAAWQNLNLNTANTVSTNGYQFLHFAMKSAHAFEICVSVQVYAGSWSSTIPNVYVRSLAPVNNQYWSVFNIPLSSLTSSTTISNILIAECDSTFGHTFYIDEVELVSVPWDSTYRNPTSNTPAPTSSSPTSSAPTSAPTTYSSSTYVIFDDAVNSAWSLYSGGTLSVYTTDKYAGSSSEKLVTTAAWQNYGFYINTAPLSTSGFTHLQFAVKISGGSTCFSVQAYNGTWTNTIPVANTNDYGGAPVSTAWKVYTIPKSGFGNPSVVSSVLLSDCSGGYGTNFYLDQVQFISQGTATTAPTKAPTSAPAAPTVAPTVAPTTVTSKTASLFEDSVASGWSLYSGGTLSLSTSVVYAGTSSEKLATTASWQNFGFYAGSNFSTAGYSYVHFAAKSGQAQSSSCLQVQAFAGTWASSIPVASTTNYGGYPSNNQWTVYNIPFSAFGNPAVITTILIADCSNVNGGNVFYIDTVRIVSVSSNV